MDRVRIRARDTADTGITAEPMVPSLHVQSFSMSPGTEVGSSWPVTEEDISSGEGPGIEVS